MISVLDDPAVRARVYPMRVEAYHRLFDLGQITEKLELLRGAIVEKMPKAPLHASIVTHLFRYLLARVPPGWEVRSEQPITFAALDSEPEPDLAVSRGTAEDFFQSHPSTAALVIEVCVSSEAIDRLKLQIYAEAGVAECWLILAEQRVMERHTEPQGAAYQRIERVTFPAALESTVFPGLTLPPAGLFPA